MDLKAIQGLVNEETSALADTLNETLRQNGVGERTSEQLAAAQLTCIMKTLGGTPIYVSKIDKLLAEQRNDSIRQARSKSMSVAQIARAHGVSQDTVLRAIKSSSPTKLDTSKPTKQLPLF